MLSSRVEVGRWCECASLPGESININPVVVKEAEALNATGYKDTICTLFTEGSLAIYVEDFKTGQQASLMPS
jgi:hypothetical protein